MRKTKILAIAPYEGLKELIVKEAERLQDVVEVMVHIGNLADSLAIAHSIKSTDFDVILSRGGTASLLKANMTQPVVDVAPSILDILRFTGIARKIDRRHALVAFPAITEIAHKVFDLIEQEERIVTLHNEEEVESVIRSLKEEGYTLIVGDAIACTTAQHFNMNAILLTSGMESVQEAYQEAIRLARAVKNAESQNLSFRSIVEESQLSVMVFNAEKEIIYSNLSDDHIDYPRIFRTITSLVPATLEQGEIQIRRLLKKYVWDITGKSMTHSVGQCAVFYIEKKLQVPRSKNNALAYYHMLADNESERAPLIDTLGQMQRVLQNVEKLGKANLPIWLSGEPGTPMSDLIAMTYAAGPWKMHTQVTVDCALLDEATLRWMVESEDSILCTNKLNLCIKNIDKLSEFFCLQYINFAQNTALHRRNRVIYASQTALPSCLSAFLNESGYVSLVLPPLRTRREDLPGLANLYLGALSTEIGHPLIGFTDGAMALIQSYDWPGNQDELKNTIRQASMLCEGEFLTEEILQSILQSRIVPVLSGNQGEKIPLDGTLAEITTRVIQAVLAQEGGNRSRTVERLGIARSTLWRMLK